MTKSEQLVIMDYFSLSYNESVYRFSTSSVDIGNKHGVIYININKLSGMLLFQQCCKIIEIQVIEIRISNTSAAICILRNFGM